MAAAALACAGLQDALATCVACAGSTRDPFVYGSFSLPCHSSDAWLKSSDMSLRNH